MVQVQIKRVEMIWYVSRTEFISFLFRALQSILEEDSVVLVGQAFRVKRQTTEGFEILTVTCRPYVWVGVLLTRKGSSYG